MFMKLGDPALMPHMPPLLYVRAIGTAGHIA
jgi:hypothetical protein